MVVIILFLNLKFLRVQNEKNQLKYKARMDQTYSSEGSNIEDRLIQFRKHGGDLGSPGDLGGEGDLGGRRFGRLCLDSRSSMICNV